jgi:hypothetical protein
MNERIKELAEQAGRGRERWNTTEQFDSFLEKFAESVIQECIKIMHTNERIPEGFFYAKPAHIHELTIKQHFGIDNE